MIDGGDPGLRCIECSGLAHRMHGDRPPQRAASSTPALSSAAVY